MSRNRGSGRGGGRVRLPGLGFGPRAPAASLGLRLLLSRCSHCDLARAPRRLRWGSGGTRVCTRTSRRLRRRKTSTGTIRPARRPPPFRGRALSRRARGAPARAPSPYWGLLPLHLLYFRLVAVPIRTLRNLLQSLLALAIIICDERPCGAHQRVHGCRRAVRFSRCGALRTCGSPCMRVARRTSLWGLGLLSLRRGGEDGVAIGRRARGDTPRDGDHDGHRALSVSRVVDEVWVRNRMCVRMAAVRGPCGWRVLRYSLRVHVGRMLGMGRPALVRCGRGRKC